MAKESNIEWTDATWNPWHGCHKKSPGCKNCYMFRDKLRYNQQPNIVARSKTRFQDPLKWKDPLKVFTCSWSDFFIEEADEWRAEAWEIIRNTPHTYQILTKEPERIGECLPSDWGEGYENVWLGTSVENADYLWRIDELLKHPAKIHWLSLEPLLGFIDLEKYLPSFSLCRSDGLTIETIKALSSMAKVVLKQYGVKTIDWIVAGGESGSKARPMNPNWARFIRNQCLAAGVPFFFKQNGEYISVSEIAGAGVHYYFPDGVTVRRVGKNKAGGLLDGEEWKEFPK